MNRQTASVVPPAAAPRAAQPSWAWPAPRAARAPRTLPASPAFRTLPALLALPALPALAWLVLASGCAGQAGHEARVEPAEPATRVTAPSDSAAGPDAGAATTDAASRPEMGRDTIVLALNEPVDPAGAPVPHNVSERTVFRNLYETLVVAGPDGALGPGLAASWTSSDGDRQWRFQLRDGARFWDGTPVRARDVLRSWRLARDVSLEARGHSPLLWVDATRGSLEAPDDATILIRLSEPQSDFPAVLAHIDLAVALPGPGPWLLGSGPCRLVEFGGAGGGEGGAGGAVGGGGAGSGAVGAGGAAGGLPATASPSLASFDPDRGGDLVCSPNPYHPSQPAWSRLVFQVRPGADPRDLLAAADLAVVRDRRDIEYYASLPDVRAQPLPWDRLYLLLVPLAQDQRDRERWYTGWNADELARDVVDAPAVPARDPFFTQPHDLLCPQLTGPVERIAWPSFDWKGIATARDRDMVLYPEGSEDARRLAERMAVVADRPLRPAPPRPGSGPLQPPYLPPPAAAPQAVAVPATDWEGAVQSGRAGAYVLLVRRQYPRACLQLSCLVGLATWLQEAAADERLSGTPYPIEARAANPAADYDLGEAMRAALRLKHGGVAVPLVFTRATLVARAGLYGVTAAFDGTPLLDGATWMTAGAGP